MLDSRVMLLSDYAHRYVDKGKNIVEEKGVWGRLLNSIAGNPQPKRQFVAGADEYMEVEELLGNGYAPFCRIEDTTVYIKAVQSSFLVAIVTDEAIWDLSEWGENYNFITRFLAEVYFMITRDDFRIDEDEKLVFLALVGCLAVTRNELIDARCLVYWTLLDKVVEDEVVTDEEQETLARIRKELELDDKNVKELHVKIINDYHEIAQRLAGDKELDREQLENIKTMASRLDVSVTF